MTALRCTKVGCGPVAAVDGTESGVCLTCGLVYRVDGDNSVVDPAATRSALFRAADACAGPNWSLQALAFDRYSAGPTRSDCLARLALAETGVASLGQLMH